MKIVAGTSMIFILLLVNIASAGPPAMPPGGGFLSGKVVLEKEGGKPLSGVLVSIFHANSGPSPDAGTVRRVPEGIIRAKSNGEFRVALPGGHYYLGVMFRDNPQIKGPPGPDENFFFPRDKEGAIRKFEVRTGRDNNIGALAGTEPETVPEIFDALAIEGTISDEKGKPFAGAMVIVRKSMKIPKPLFISPRTGADGKYRLQLPPGGPYYLVVRENLVDLGRPRPGGFIGTYGGNAPQNFGQATSVFADGKPVGGTANQVLKGIDITIYRIPDPEEIKSSRLQESEKLIFPGRGTQQRFPGVKSVK